MHQYGIIDILQASLTPVILISGVGLLLLNMTNRIARPLDRIRFIGRELKTSDKQEQEYYLRQIEILYKRCYLLQSAITSAAITAICASSIILLLFLTAKFSLTMDILIETVFIVGISALIVSMYYFLLDIRASLKSVQIEMQRLKLNYADINIERSFKSKR